MRLLGPSNQAQGVRRPGLPAFPARSQRRQNGGGSSAQTGPLASVPGPCGCSRATRTKPTPHLRRVRLCAEPWWQPDSPRYHAYANTDNPTQPWRCAEQAGASQVAHYGGIVVKTGVVNVTAVVKAVPLAQLVPGYSPGRLAGSRQPSPSL